jgi:hypothetical protein
MRFMMVVIRKGYETAAADAAPGAEAVAKMMEYNKSLQKAGVLLGLDGLLPLRPEHLFPTWTARQRLQKYRSLRPKRLSCSPGPFERLFPRTHLNDPVASDDGQQRDHRSAPNLREGRFLHSRAERSRAESSRRLRGAFERGCGKGVSDIQA